MTLQFMIVMIASAINDRLQRKLDYVEEERRILREQLNAATGITGSQMLGDSWNIKVPFNQWFWARAGGD